MCFKVTCCVESFPFSTIGANVWTVLWRKNCELLESARLPLKWVYFGEWHNVQWASLFRFLLPLPTNFHLDKNRYICNTTHYQILGPLASNEATEATDATEGLPPVPPTADKVETYAEESQVFDIVFFVVLAANWALFTHACILATCRSTLQILWPGASCDRCGFFHDVLGCWLIFLI